MNCSHGPKWIYFAAMKMKTDPARYIQPRICQTCKTPVVIDLDTDQPTELPGFTVELVKPNDA